MSNSSPSKRLFVGSLPFKFTEGQLLEIFAPYGRIVSLRIMHTRWGKSRGIGYVEYDSLDAAVSAKNALHNKSVGDRTIIVDYSKPDPFLTPEGQQRHDDAQARRQKYHNKNVKKQENKQSKPQSSSSSSIGDDFRPRGFMKSSSGHQRQSIYDSRRYGKRVGAKFASRNKKKKNS